MNKNKLNEDRLLNDKEMQLIYGFSRKTLQNHRTKRIGLSYIKIGKSVRYRKGDVDAYLNKNKYPTEK